MHVMAEPIVLLVVAAVLLSGVGASATVELELAWNPLASSAGLSTKALLYPGLIVSAEIWRSTEGSFSHAEGYCVVSNTPGGWTALGAGLCFYNHDRLPILSFYGEFYPGHGLIGSTQILYLPNAGLSIKASAIYLHSSGLSIGIGYRMGVITPVNGWFASLGVSL